MKVTVILPDDLIRDVQKLSGGKNITESLKLALTEWLKMAKLKKLNAQLLKTPLKFVVDYSAESVGILNRTRG